MYLGVCASLNLSPSCTHLFKGGVCVYVLWLQQGFPFLHKKFSPTRTACFSLSMPKRKLSQDVILSLVLKDTNFRGARKGLRLQRATFPATSIPQSHLVSETRRYWRGLQCSTYSETELWTVPKFVQCTAHTTVMAATWERISGGEGRFGLLFCLFDLMEGEFCTKMKYLREVEAHEILFSSIEKDRCYQFTWPSKRRLMKLCRIWLVACVCPQAASLSASRTIFSKGQNRHTWPPASPPGFQQQPRAPDTRRVDPPPWATADTWDTELMTGNGSGRQLAWLDTG